MNGWDLAGELIPLGFLAALTVWDIREKALPLWLLALGFGCGIAFRALRILLGHDSLTQAAGQYLPGLLPGALLWLFSRFGKGAIGPGDGVCFMMLALWQPVFGLLGTLLLALFLAGIGGGAWLLIRRKPLRSALPFLPFVLTAYLAECAAGWWGDL